MNDFYFYNYLKRFNNKNNSYLDLLKIELDNRIYYYGNHFKYPKETSDFYFMRFFRKLKLKIKLKIKLVRYNNVKISFEKRIILNNSYFSLDKEIEEYQIFTPLHSLNNKSTNYLSYSTFKKFLIINDRIENSSFTELLEESLLNLIEDFEKSLINEYKKLNISALITSNDMNFFDLLNIKICKKLNIPSFIFLHGIPATYNDIDNNRADYLIVWGNKIKENYLKYTNINPEKILIAGHPFYKKSFSSRQLKNSFQNILIISKTPTGSQFSDRVRVQDRGNSILYLMLLKDVLNNFGVKSVKLRVHPSENINWYYQFVDKNFFIEDKSSLSDSLNSSTLVIGPRSTVFIEALYYGVNYIIFEPIINNLDMYGYTPAPPFDVISLRTVFAANSEDLNSHLLKKSVVDISIFDDYVSTPFNIDFLNKVI